VTRPRRGRHAAILAAMRGDAKGFIETLTPEVLVSFMRYCENHSERRGYKQAIEDLTKGARLIGEQAAIERLVEFFRFADELDEASAKAFLDHPS